jgi:ATP-dependent Clp protease protease subunit
MKDRIDVLLPGMNDDSSFSPYDEFIKEDLKNRILLINERITDIVIDEQVMCILRWNAEDKDIPVEKRKTITIYLNSEGGSSFDGQALIDVMLASKTKIRTVGFGMVASMAYLIFLAGNERIGFENTSFLQHEGEAGVSGLSSSKAKETMAFFDDMEERTKKYILSKSKITEETYDKFYKREWWMYSQEAKENGIVDKIIGEDCDIDILFS